MGLNVLCVDYLKVLGFVYLFILTIRKLVCQGGSGLVGDEDTFGSGGGFSARIESSHVINLRDLDMKHVKDFIFVHGECV